ncbi:MAG TPA: hypothetical protein VG274_07550, partial [Rhizomicrobium sp.]|nr:hypothetical protein [Rhizomicrobium sp.]
SDGKEMADQSWKDPNRRLLCLRRASTNEKGGLELLSFLLNPTAEDEFFILPKPALPGRILIDTTQPDSDEIPLTDIKVAVRSHGAVLVYSKPERPLQ